MPKIYDASLKEFFHGVPETLLAMLTPHKALRLETVEFSQVEQRTPDLIVTLDNGELWHLEIQSDNDPRMHWRMLNYYSRIREVLNKPLTQKVIYVGLPSIQMPCSITDANLHYHYEIIDLRNLDCRPLLHSSNSNDIMLSILCRQGTDLANIQKILQHIETFDRNKQKDLLIKLFFLGRLRQVETLIVQELDTMPFRIDVEGSPILEELFEKARAKVIAKAEAAAEARGKAKFLTTLLVKRFGGVPLELQEKIAVATDADLERWSGRLFTAMQLNDIFAE